MEVPATVVLQSPSLEAGSKRESITTEPRLKMPNFVAEINMFTAWFKTLFWSLKLIFYVCDYITRVNFL